MRLTGLPSGSRCFVDANILYYYFVDTPVLSPACSGLVVRIESGNVTRGEGLLTNDATIVALMRRHGRADLASNDVAAVAGVTLCRPR